MMCPQCGNTDFTGQDTRKTVVCPVAGCGLRIDPEHPAYVRIRTEVPAGSFFARASAGKEEEGGDA